jgi:hypothetical protein
MFPTSDYRAFPGAAYRVLLLALWTWFPVTGMTSAGELAAVTDSMSMQSMQRNFDTFRRNRDSGDLALPFSLDSLDNASETHASVHYFLEGVPLKVFRQRLDQPSEWCEFIPLHLNIKACSYLEQGGNTLVRFYAGIKGYVTPDKAHLLELRYSSGEMDGIYFVHLFARDGPLDSSDISFTIRAIDVDRDGWRGVYLEFDLSSMPGLAASLARVYLATIARNKVGFSVDGTTWTGKPAYVSGQRGATERNIVRYLLAIETYFDTLDLPAEDRYRVRLERWFDATEQFHRQLYELPRKEYINNKLRERQNQEILQQSIADGVPPEFNPVDRRR